MKISLLWLAIVSCIPVFSQTNNALVFNGTSDYASVGSPITTGTSYTKEAWVFALDNVGPRNIFSSQDNPLWVLNGVLQGGHGNNYTVVADIFGTFPIQRWTHVALTYDAGTNRMTLYRDGQLSAFGFPALPYVEQTAYIGSHFGTASYWRGNIDEVRVWNRALTKTEIAMNMYKGPPANATGLRAYYKMDEPSGTALINAAPSGNGISGTLVSGSRTPSPVQSTANALQFDGVNDYVNIGNGASLKMTTAVTNEVWVKSSNWVSAGIKTITSCFEVGGYGITLENNALMFTVAVGGVYYNASVPQTSLINNTWYHVAGTFDGRYIRLYINGILANSNDLGLPAGKLISYSFAGNSMHIGAEAGPGNVPVGDYFGGEIDEVRIWNVARTGAQILANIGGELNPADATQTSGLVAYYTFNQGITAGLNTGLAAAPDIKGTNTGTLTNFSLTGTTSNYSLQPITLIALPVTWTYFTVQADRANAVLSWGTANEQQSKEFEVRHSPDGTNWLNIGTVSAAGNSSVDNNYNFTHTKPINGINFYRLAQKDFDGKLTYSAVRRLVFSATPNDFTLQGNLVVNGRIGVQVNKPLTISVFSIDGKLLLRKPMAAGFQNLELSRAAKGIYWLSAGGITEKILVQ